MRGWAWTSLNLEAVEGLKDAGIHLVDGWRALNKARAVKTVDELQLIRWTTRAKERGYDLVRESLRDSNVPERSIEPDHVGLFAGPGIRSRQRVHFDL